MWIETAKWYREKMSQDEALESDIWGWSWDYEVYSVDDWPDSDLTV